jgi:hypothetical protein
MWLPAPPVGLWNCWIGMPVADLDLLGKHLMCVRVWQAGSALAGSAQEIPAVSAFANTYGTRRWTCGAVCSRPGGVWSGSAFRLDGKSWVRRHFRLILFPPRAYLVRMGVRTKRKRSVCRCLRACRCCAWFHVLRAAVHRRRRCWLMFILGCIFRHHLAPQT